MRSTTSSRPVPSLIGPICAAATFTQRAIGILLRVGAYDTTRRLTGSERRGVSSDTAADRACWRSEGTRRPLRHLPDLRGARTAADPACWRSEGTRRPLRHLPDLRGARTAADPACWR